MGTFSDDYVFMIVSMSELRTSSGVETLDTAVCELDQVLADTTRGATQATLQCEWSPA